MKNRFVSEMQTDNGENKFKMKYFLKGAVYGAFTGIILLMIFSLILKTTSIDDKYIPIFSYFAISLGGYICGKTTAKSTGKKRILSGILGGIIFVIFLYLIGCIISGTMNSFSEITINWLLAIICSTFGGIVGNNKKSKRRI